MEDVAYLLGGIAAIGCMTVAIAVTRNMGKHFVEEGRKYEREQRVKEAIRQHAHRVEIETKCRDNRHWPSGRTWTDHEDVVHTVPAGYFAVTICGKEIEPSSILAEEVVDRYPYDPAVSCPTTCFACLGGEE